MPRSWLFLNWNYFWIMWFAWPNNINKLLLNFKQFSMDVWVIKLVRRTGSESINESICGLFLGDDSMNDSNDVGSIRDNWRISEFSKRLCFQTENSKDVLDLIKGLLKVLRQNRNNFPPNINKVRENLRQFGILNESLQRNLVPNLPMPICYQANPQISIPFNFLFKGIQCF